MRNKMENPSKYLGNELKYIKKVLNSENWSASAGNWNQTLEGAFAKKIGTKYAIAMNSGTSTLHAALEAVGVGSGDEVISPGLTVIMDSTATIHANAVPVYADVNPETFTIDPKDIARKITDKTKAIIAVSLYGLSPDYDPILKIAKKHDIAIIEDNAQCFLSTYKGRMTGTIGDMASYSFENTKHLSCGEGGILVTDNEQYAETARKIGGHGYKNLKASEGRVKLNQDVFQNPHYKRIDTLGWNYRLSEFNAAITMAQLERLDEFVQLRIKTANIFIDVMKDCDYLIPQKTPKGYTNSYYTLGVIYNGLESIGISWEKFRKAYDDAGGDGIYGACSVPYLEPVIAERKYVSRCPWVYENVHYHLGMCPNAERVQPLLMQFKTNYRDLSLAKKRQKLH
jgi:perosamine synthetase